MTDWLAYDIGGANLKIADGNGFARSRPFALWEHPGQLTEQLRLLATEAPAAEAVAVTMTGELADCYVNKRRGVQSILDAVMRVYRDRPTVVYRTDGQFVSIDKARAEPRLCAASNWHALARFAARFLDAEHGLLIDIGSTTSDIVPISADGPVTDSMDDTQRLLANELVYTGVERSPVCAVVKSVPYRGRQCPVAQEFFATTKDVYLTLGNLDENVNDTNTADGRPSTRDAARVRLSRCVCADNETFTDSDAITMSRGIAEQQLEHVSRAVHTVIERTPLGPHTIVVSGQGEFLGRALVDRMRLNVRLFSLSEALGPVVSRCATAQAVAVLARELVALGTDHNDQSQHSSRGKGWRQSI